MNFELQPRTTQVFSRATSDEAGAGIGLGPISNASWISVLNSQQVTAAAVEQPMVEPSVEMNLEDKTETNLQDKTETDVNGDTVVSGETETSMSALAATAEGGMVTRLYGEIEEIRTKTVEFVAGLGVDSVDQYLVGTSIALFLTGSVLLAVYISRSA